MGSLRNESKVRHGRGAARVGSRAARGIAMAAAVLFPGTVSAVITRNWNVGSGGSWTTGTNWSPAGTPGGTDIVNIAEGDGVSRTITYDYTGAAVALGQLTINLLLGVPSGTTTLSMSGNNLSVAGGEFIGNSGGSNNGSGTMIQSGGVNSMGANLTLGNNATDRGFYTLSGTGSLLVNTGAEVIGNSGSGNFTQTGGSNTAGNLEVGNLPASNGSYSLSGTGTLNVTNLYEIIGSSGTGMFAQSGGSNTLGAGVALYLAGSTGSNGSYVQSAGTTTVSAGGSLRMALPSGSTAAYTLSGTGALSVSGDEFVGAQGNATFTQTGGVNTIDTGGYLGIGGNVGGVGSYNLSGGTLNALNVYVGGLLTGPGGKGTLAVSGTGTLSMGSGNTLLVYNTAGSGISLSGGSITTGSLNLMGNLSLFSWSAGTLNLTNPSFNVNIDSTASANLASSLNLNSSQTLSVAATENIGLNGTGSVNQFGGSNTAGGLNLGSNSLGAGTYTLSNAAVLNVNSGGEYVGEAGSGVFIQTGGTHTVGASGTLNVGGFAGSTGSYSLSGTSVLAVNDGYENIGLSGNGTFMQTGGSNTLSTGSLVVGNNAGSVGLYTLSAGNVTVNWNVFVGSAGTGTFTQTGGNTAINGGGYLFLGFYSGSVGTYSLSGGNVSVSGQMTVGGTNNLPGGTGVLNVSGMGVMTVGQGIVAFNTPGSVINLSGGTLNTVSLNVHGVPGLLHWTGGTLGLTAGIQLDPSSSSTSTAAAFGTALTVGNGQTLAVTGGETLGGGGPFTLTIGSGGANSVSGSLGVTTGSTLFLAGGTLSSGVLAVAGAGSRMVEQSSSFASGTSLSVTNGGLFQANQGGQFSYTTQVLTFNNGAEISLDGGASLSTPLVDVENNSVVAVGNAVITASANIQIESGGELQPASSVNSILNAPTVTNFGLLDGSARVNAKLLNQAGGEIDSAAGQLLSVSGSGSTNGGLISLAGGTVHFTQGLINSSGAAIAGYGTLRVDGGLTNSGSFAAGGQSTSLFGAITNNSGAFFGLAGATNVFGNFSNAAAASVRLSGNTPTVFYGSFSNSGSLAIDAGATGIFYGVYSGNAPILNSGSIFINSSAVSGAITGGGNLTLGFAATPATAQVTPGSGTSKLSSLTLNSTSQLDLTNNPLIIEATSGPAKSALMAQLLGEVSTGFNGGTFDGPGIVSTTALAANSAAGKTVRVVAVVDNAVRLATFPIGSTNFGGVNNVDASSILVAAAFKGDANLDGVVDIQDLTDVANHWQQAAVDWSQGDFDNNHSLDILDLTAVANNWQAGTGSGGEAFVDELSLFPSFGGTVAATPEPASLVLLGLGGLVVAGRRRR